MKFTTHVYNKYNFVTQYIHLPNTRKKKKKKNVIREKICL